MGADKVSRPGRREFLRRSLGAMMAGPVLRAVPPPAMPSIASWVDIPMLADRAAIDGLIGMAIKSVPAVSRQYANEHWGSSGAFGTVSSPGVDPDGPPTPRHEPRKGVSLLEHVLGVEPVSGHPGAIRRNVVPSRTS